MAGGKSINDHAFWAGSPTMQSALPTGFKHKNEAQIENEVNAPHFEDTSEVIHSSQEMGIRKAKSHSQKPLHRN